MNLVLYILYAGVAFRKLYAIFKPQIWIEIYRGLQIDINLIVVRLMCPGQLEVKGFFITNVCPTN